MILPEFARSPSSSSESDSEKLELSPTQLLAIAIKKRRALYNSKSHDFRREVLHTGMIQNLCKYLGEFRARRRRRRSKRRQRASRKRQWNAIIAIESEDDVACMPGAMDDVVQMRDNGDSPCKKACVDDDDDPFGLDELFARYVYHDQPRMVSPVRG